MKTKCQSAVDVAETDTDLSDVIECETRNTRYSVSVLSVIMMSVANQSHHQRLKIRLFQNRWLIDYVTETTVFVGNKPRQSARTNGEISCFRTTVTGN